MNQVGKILTSKKLTNVNEFINFDCHAYCTHAALLVVRSEQILMHMHLHVHCN